MIPTSIDGTDITGATIDGTDVTEITVDGQTVFSAQTLPVAYSNLVAWYPFDSAEYGGFNADDVTAIIGGSGDDTAYDGTVNGATYQSSDGVTDINAGANSGAFDFDGSDDIALGNDSGLEQVPGTYCGWMKMDINDIQYIFGGAAGANMWLSIRLETDLNRFTVGWGGNFENVSVTVDTNEWYHVAARINNSSDVDMILDGLVLGTNTGSEGNNGDDKYIGSRDDSFGRLDGTVDDFRIYNTALTNTQINQIITNTQP